MRRTLTASFLSMALFSSTAEAVFTFRTVALSGDAAPGTATGAKFSSFLTPPAINGAGQTAFFGGLTGGGGTGIWSEGRGAGLALVARRGAAAPGTGAGVNFNNFFFDPPVLNNAGQTAFRGTLTGAGVEVTNNEGIWSEGGGSGLALVAREGAAASGTDAGLKLGNFPTPLVLNAAGQTAFHGSLYVAGVDGTNDEVIWSEDGGSGLALVAREGAAAPDTGAGVSLSSFRTPPVLNGAGQTSFYSFLTGAGVVDTNDEGIWSVGGGSGLALVVREGDAAPGTGAGVNFDGFGLPMINDAGQIAFWGVLAGAGVNSTNNQGIWLKGGGAGLSLVVRESDAAPGTAAGVNFSGMGALVLNGAGQTAFIGSLTGAGVDSTNDRGIWSEGGGAGLALVAREGSAAPGTGDGVDFISLSAPVLNSAGQTAFIGSLTGAGVDSTNDRGIWSEGNGAGIALVARNGDLFDVNDDPLVDNLRTVAGLTMVRESGGEDGRPTSFNDAGQLAFLLAFTDGSSGIFVATPVPVPEPATAGLVLVGLAVLLPRRRYVGWLVAVVPSVGLAPPRKPRMGVVVFFRSRSGAGGAKWLARSMCNWTQRR